jgi:biopolymer transport protein ExbB
MNKTCRAFLCLKMLTLTLMLILVWNGPAWTQDDAAATWETIHEDLAEQTRTIAKEVKTTKAIIIREQTELEDRAAELKAAIAKEQKRLNERKREFNRLLAQEQKSRLALEEHQEDIKNLETVIRSAAREADTMIHDSLISPAFAERQKMISPLLDADRFPGFADIEKLIGLFFQEAEETGKITLINNSIIGPDGSRTSAEVLRIGAFTAFYRLDNGRVGYLRTGKDGKTWIAVPASLGRNVVNRIEAAFDGQSPDIPLDISRGAALQGLGQQKDVLQWLRSGGVLVWPILFVGGIALLLAFERMIVLLRQKTTPGAVMTRILSLVGSNDWEGCKTTCAAMSRIPALRVIGRSVEAAGSSKEVLEATLEEAVLKEIPPMERFLATLNILAAIAPLLGLLGTVTGMISTFQVITLYGTGDPRMMSGGISEALITTQLGLAVAIPIMIVHHFLQRRVETLISDMEEKGTAFAAAILDGKQRH